MPRVRRKAKKYRSRVTDRLRWVLLTGGDYWFLSTPEEKEFWKFFPEEYIKAAWEEYREACTSMGDRMAHLGAHEKLTRSKSADRVAGARKSHAMKSMGSRLFFGQERWEFMLTLMLGLQIAVEDSKEELDRAAQVSPTPWPLADDLSRWAAF